MFVRVNPGEPGVWPERQLLYNPSPTVFPESRLQPNPLLIIAEHAELRDRDYARAVRLYQRAVTGARPERHATALHRLARTLRKAGRDAEALAAYEQLATSTDRIGVLPAELIARFEICVLLAEQGKSDALTRTALALYRDLVAGRWWLEKARFAHYAARTRQWLARDTASADELSRWAAIEERKGTLTLAAEAVLATGTLHRATTTDAVAVIQARAGRPVALLLSREWLSTTIWPQTFASAHASGFDIALLGPGTQVWFGSREVAEPTLVAVRVAEDGRVPWRRTRHATRSRGILGRRHPPPDGLPGHARHDRRAARGRQLLHDASREARAGGGQAAVGLRVHGLARVPVAAHCHPPAGRTAGARARARGTSAAGILRAHHRRGRSARAPGREHPRVLPDGGRPPAVPLRAARHGPVAPVGRGRNTRAWRQARG